MATNPFGTTIPRGVTPFYDFSQNNDGGQPGATNTPYDGGNVTPAPPSLATPTLNGNSGSSSSTSTTTTTVTSPYAQFKGNNYAELEEFLRGQMDAIKPETKEEREKREKREKRIAFLARLAEGLGTFHTAFSHARGIKAMDMPKMSAKAKELFEKAKAQRDKDNDRLVNYAITLGNIKDKDRDFNFRVTQADRQQQNWQQGFDYGKERDKRKDEQWQQGFDYAKEQDDRKFKEGQRQFDAQNKLAWANHNESVRAHRASEGLQRAHLAASQDGKYTEFYSPSGGLIKVRNSALNAHNLAYVYKQIKDGDGNPLPTTKAVYKSGSFTPSYEPIDANEMMTTIGEHIDDVNVQNALKAIGGHAGVQSKKPLPGSETNGKKQLP